MLKLNPASKKNNKRSQRKYKHTQNIHWNSFYLQLVYHWIFTYNTLVKIFQKIYSKASARRSTKFNTDCILNAFMLKIWQFILLYTCVHQVLNDVIESVFWIPFKDVLSLHYVREHQFNKIGLTTTAFLRAAQLRWLVFLMKLQRRAKHEEKKEFTQQLSFKTTYIWKTL
jgi:hypothetical protein